MFIYKKKTSGEIKMLRDARYRAPRATFLRTLTWGEKEKNQINCCIVVFGMYRQTPTNTSCANGRVYGDKRDK